MIVFQVVHYCAATALLLMLIGKLFQFFFLQIQHKFSCVRIEQNIRLLICRLFIRCTPPHKSTDYQKIYSDWCNEFEKYKSAMKSWEKKQVVSAAILFFSILFIYNFIGKIFFGVLFLYYGVVHYRDSHYEWGAYIVIYFMIFYCEVIFFFYYLLIIWWIMCVFFFLFIIIHFSYLLILLLY